MATDRPQSAPAPAHVTPAQLREEHLALLRACFQLFRGKLVELARTSIELSGDLFDGVADIATEDVDEFKTKRNEWLQRFDRMLVELYDRRIAGKRRKGRRLDPDASLATLRVLTPFDHEKQAALTATANFLDRHTLRERAALDLRVGELLPSEGPGDVDNPFAPVYVLDAIGAPARALYPNPRIWRPFMERLIADLTPGANNLYIALNRFLADRGVLPDIKAKLRARSEFRPVEDSELFSTFGRMLQESAPARIADVAVPTFAGDEAPGDSAFDFDRFARSSAVPADALPSAASADRHGGPGTDFDQLAKRAIEAFATLVPSSMQAPIQRGGGLPVPVLSAPMILSGLANLAAAAAQAPPLPGAAGEADGMFPSLDPMMALGSSSSLFDVLARLQRIDLPVELARSAREAAPAMTEAEALPPGAVVPFNLIPHIRAATSDQVVNPADRITMDVIALVFDYIFRDPSIPDSERQLFGRLQVPVLKAALLDRSFFSDARHPARRVLDHLAEAAIGASDEGGYRDAFETEATDIVDEVCRDFEIDVAAFERADLRVQRFIESERRETEEAAKPTVDAALAAEEGDVDGAQVRVLIRAKLAGADIPFEVRGFVETVWADYLASVRKAKGEQSTEWVAALHTLDDLLWSITAKERAAQRARLTRMIPGLLGGLRRGVTALDVPAERAKPFFDLIYQLHMSAIKAKPAAPTAPASAATTTSTDVPAQRAGDAPGAGEPPAPTDAERLGALGNVHDFVSEMIVGTWLAFTDGDAKSFQARLSWVSPMRTKYLFTSHERARALVLAPEELAWRIGSGKATLIVEPVPLFDRAVSAALDTLAASKPPEQGAPDRVSQAA